VNYGK